ncbi:hypothetical protein RQP46_001441 [Phenoliferia psychrophenolica]
MDTPHTMTPHTMITLNAALEVERSSPAPSHFATVDPAGPRTDPTASVRSVLETSNTIFSALMSSLSYWCMSHFSLESPDVLLVVFVMGAVLNSLSMVIILVAEIRDVRKHGVTKLRPQPLSFWISCFLDVVVAVLLLRVLQTEGWKDAVGVMFAWFSDSEGPSTEPLKRAIISLITFVVLLQSVGAVADAAVEVARGAMEDAEELRWSQARLPAYEQAVSFVNEKHVSVLMA